MPFASWILPKKSVRDRSGILVGCAKGSPQDIANSPVLVAYAQAEFGHKHTPK